MNQDLFLKLRKEYPEFIYHRATVLERDTNYLITYDFEIVGLETFHPTIQIDKEKIISHDLSVISFLAYQIGLVEAISYWKCTCSPKVIIEAGPLCDDQKKWFLKLFYLGLGEFRYVNGIDCSMEEWVTFEASSEERKIEQSFEGKGNLIAIGGGKDSAVSLHLLKEEDNTCFMINPKTPGMECMEIAGYQSYLKVERTIDKKLLELNQRNFLNGHTPFSALVAFLSYLCAYLTNRKYIVLSNEGSANEATVLGTKINHQYSKTYEFEDDFNQYAKKYLPFEIHYFSMLRCLNELQIAMLFSRYSEFHHAFKSCNVGSKEIPWRWCCNCPKCLFVYIILSPFLSREQLLSIFGENLYDKEELLNTFLELLGHAPTKPFECVGTYEEVRYAVSKAAPHYEDSYLIKYYQEHYHDEIDENLVTQFNTQHHIPEHFLQLVRKELENHD